MNEHLLRVVEAHTRHHPHIEAEVASQAALEALSGLLPELDAAPLHRAAGVTTEPTGHGASLSEAERHVAARLRVSEGEASEVLRLVVSALPRAVDESLRQRMTKHLPDPLARVLDAAELVPGETPMGPADAPPEVRPADRARAHRDSVVNTDRPRADRKLSSGRGTMDEKTGRIADGRAESADPLAEAAPGDARSEDEG